MFKVFENFAANKQIAMTEDQETKYQRKYGSRSEVWEGTAKQTRGGLLRDGLMLSRNGRIVSKKKSQRASELYKEFGFRKRAKPEPIPEEPEKPKKRRRRKKI